MQWNLIKLRKEHEETQEELSQLLGISESAYRNKELGKNQFKLDEMFALAKHYNERVDEIFLPTDFTVRKENLSIR